jgi:hypothetical protein
MKYFRIRYTLDPKVRGCQNDTIKGYKYYGDVYDPKFIGRINFEKVDFNPIPVSPILYAKAKKTDLIQEGGQLSGKIVISTKLKNLLQKNDYGVQYFQNSIIHNEIEDNTYWSVSPYQILDEYIDFRNSIIIHRKKKEGGGTTPIELIINSFTEYKSKLKEVISNDEIMYIEKAELLENSIKVDFFPLKHLIGGNFYVSEKLKQDIEDSGCTGIEFQPIELSYNEWTAPGGEREKVYGKI